MFNSLSKFINKPELFTIGTDVFWNDEHISKALLDAKEQTLN